MSNSTQRDPSVLAVYGIQRGVLDFGVERMALATLRGLQGHYRTLLIAPDGKVHDRAAVLGIPTQRASSQLEFGRVIAGLLRSEQHLVFLTGSVEQSLIVQAAGTALRRLPVHIHVAHGGPEPVGYRRKPWLNHVQCQIVAVSDYVRRRLVIYGVNPDKITVIDNFLESERAAALASIEHDPQSLGRRVLSLIKLEPWKRPHLVFEALDRRPELCSAEFHIVGTGDLLGELRERASDYPNVQVPGFSEQPDRELAQADLLLHPNSEEPFGLVVLEAMYAGVPVLVPDAGGAGDLVEDGVTGFRFAADNPASLADRLVSVLEAPEERLAVAAEARCRAQRLYHPEVRLEDYRALIESMLVNR